MNQWTNGVGPWAAAVDPQGVIYLTFDSALGKYSADGQHLATLLPISGLPRFVDLVLATDGTIWTLNAASQVSSYQETVATHSWGGEGAGPGYLNHPQGLAVTSAGEVIVADTDNNRVQVFSASGLLLTAWGNEGTGQGEFHDPTAVFLDETGAVYVVDSGNNRIQKFTW